MTSEETKIFLTDSLEELMKKTNTTVTDQATYKFLAEEVIETVRNRNRNRKKRKCYNENYQSESNYEETPKLSNLFAHIKGIDVYSTLAYQEYKYKIGDNVKVRLPVKGNKYKCEYAQIRAFLKYPNKRNMTNVLVTWYYQTDEMDNELIKDIEPSIHGEEVYQSDYFDEFSCDFIIEPVNICFTDNPYSAKTIFCRYKYCVKKGYIDNAMIKGNRHVLYDIKSFVLNN